MVQQAMLRLQDEETAIQSKLEEYDRGGRSLLDVLSRSHEAGLKQYGKELVPTKSKLVDMLRCSASQLAEAEKENSTQTKVRSLGKGIDERYQSLGAKLARATELYK